MYMRKSIPLIEFYITNVCNLTCRGCNRFNNYNFKGHQYWDDHALAYEAWSKRLEIPSIWILGGEPTLNPDLEKWCINLRRLWPKSEINIQSNGTQHKKIFDTFWEKYQIGWGIALHDQSVAKEIKRKWHGSGFDAFVFHEAAVIEKGNELTVHRSLPNKAFEFCDMKYDHTMYNGKLYKCPTVAILPEFNKQKPLALDAAQEQLLDSYIGLGHDCGDEELDAFIGSRDHYIPQCEFCPQSHNWRTALGPLVENLPAPDYSAPSVVRVNTYKSSSSK
jgi:organic radical activating enzyme